MARRFAQAFGRSVLLAIGLSGATAALAQDVPDAVGRVAPVDSSGNTLGDAICTGVLVAADLVLTAGHCLPEQGATALFAFDIAPSASGPRLRATGRAFERLAPRPLGPFKLDNDLALLRLDAPVSPETATPIALATGDLPLFATFFGFDRTQPDAMPLGQICNRLGRWPEEAPRVVAFDCPVVSGNSGGPLLYKTPDGWALVAIMAARGGGPFASFAVIPPDDPRW